MVVCDSFSVVLRKRYRSKQTGSELAEVRAWKLFGLVPEEQVLLVETRSHRADELARRRCEGSPITAHRDQDEEGRRHRAGSNVARSLAFDRSSLALCWLAKKITFRRNSGAYDWTEFEKNQKSCSSSVQIIL